MARIQIEKAMPYSTEEMTTASEIISQKEEGSVISAVAVHNEQLSELAAPLLSLGLIPSQVTVYAAQRAATHAPVGAALLIYPENGAIVCAITEEGKLSFTRTLDAADPLQLQRDLPQLTLSAELQGINTSFPKILLDESLYELRDTVEGIFASSVELDRGGGAAGRHRGEPPPGKLAPTPGSSRQARENGGSGSSGPAAPMPPCWFSSWLVCSSCGCKLGGWIARLRRTHPGRNSSK